MASGTSWKELEQRISGAIKLPRRAVAVGFLDAAPAGLEEFRGTEPFIPLSATRERETEQTLKMMFDLGYVKREEVPQIPRLAKTPVAIAYAPLGDATFTPDAVRSG